MLEAYGHTPTQSFDCIITNLSQCTQAVQMGLLSGDQRQACWFFWYKCCTVLSWGFAVVL